MLYSVGGVNDGGLGEKEGEQEGGGLLAAMELKAPAKEEMERAEESGDAEAGSNVVS